MSTKSTKWAVVYVATKNAKLFAGIQDEIIHVVDTQDEATELADFENQGGYIDELHVGYRARLINE